jgi:hypothetical protein
MPNSIKIRLYADMVFSYSRGILRGISDFAKLQGGWDVEFYQRF